MVDRGSGLPCPFADSDGMALPSLAAVRAESRDGPEEGLITEAAQPFIGKELSFRQICELRDAVSRRLAANGFVADVRIPSQDFAMGDLTLDVVLGRLVALRVRGDTGGPTHLVEGQLRPLIESDRALNLYDLERHLREVNAIPGYVIGLTLRPSQGGREGDLIGTLDVEFRGLRADGNVNNYNDGKVPWIGTVRAEYASLFGGADRTLLSLFGTLGKPGLRGFQAGQEFQLGVGGPKLSLTALRATEILRFGAAAGASAKLRSRSAILTAKASFPLTNSVGFTSHGVLGFDYVDVKVDFFGPLTRDRLRIVFGQFNAEGEWGAAAPGTLAFASSRPVKARASLEVRKGLKILNATPTCTFEDPACSSPGVPSSRFEGDAASTVFRASARLEYQPARDVTIRLAGAGQYSVNPVFADEEFSLGNYTFGRGYPQGVLSGGKGFGLRAELEIGKARPLSSRGLAFAGYAFGDLGHVSHFGRFSSETIRSLGGGVRGLFGGDASIDAMIAVPLKRASLQTVKGNPRFLLTFTSNFLPLPRFR